MLYKITLRNCQNEEVLLSEEAYNLITLDPEYAGKNLAENLRKHSNGYAFYQKNHPLRDGSYQNETLYLHKILADKFLGTPPGAEHRYVMFRNGNKLDCRIENLSWATRSEITRNTRKHHSKSGYRGVYREGDRYRATLYNRNERIDIGFFESAEEAAMAYNQKSIEIFGRTRSLNKVEAAPKNNPVEVPEENTGFGRK